MPALMRRSLTSAMASGSRRTYSRRSSFTFWAAAWCWTSARFYGSTNTWAGSTLREESPEDFQKILLLVRMTIEVFSKKRFSASSPRARTKLHFKRRQRKISHYQ
jgi:hypothetical protein